jgi:hypothetical protein
METVTLIKTNYNHHVSMDLYHEFEKSIIKNTDWGVENSLTGTQAKIIRPFLKYLPPFQIPIRSKKNYLIIGFQKEKFFPYFYYRCDKKILWMYDSWEPLFPRIKKTIDGFKINMLLTGSKQSADYFNNLNIKNFTAHWIPEAVDIDNYRFIDYRDRKIDVLQLGRKWNELHENIQSIENEFGISYVFEKIKGEVIFKDREDFINGLANSKISICIPTIITHPDKTGSISTMTNRYLQSMASKCLVLGKLPYDMQYLFDYNPVVEIDTHNPIAQIESILKNFDSYIPLIEKNYETVSTRHTWKNRVEELKKII